MKTKSIFIWSWVHTWSSLISTIFLVMLCVTGLPLIFHDDIDTALNPDVWEPANPAGEHLDLDQVLALSLDNRPGEVPIYMSFDTARPVVNVTTAPSASAPGSQMHFASFDLTSGNLVPPADVGEGVMEFILQLHTDMFLALPGMLFLGLMGFTGVVAVVSGAVLYAPFMRKQNFGVIRRQKSKRVKWLDYHNFLGVATLAWVLVVTVTGVINALETPLIDAWRDRELGQLISQNTTTSLTKDKASLDAAVKEAVLAAPDMTLQFVAFPGSAYSSSAHYAIFLHGDTPLTEHLITPVLVNAGTGQIAGQKEMPWYIKALSLSRPLHFGDYGGLTQKIVWAVLDISLLIVLLSGLYLWWKKHRTRDSEATSGKGIAL
ncbi:PepSY-associated TM helix domain-containing protein [Gilvimarinus polysaccharolyticus]|uniref:PepSY-associated TM helix domain-containing protein n=1 Tax=Gilvimarinus polysaccharolyticus TaxID=863921 RepID=UPI0006738D83|nr:PepSY domain-containing protein [Gilvimarinus polysaccharolyticus]